MCIRFSYDTNVTLSVVVPIGETDTGTLLKIIRKLNWFLTKLYNRTMESERMPEEWRDGILIPIFKNKGEVQSYSNYRGIKLISHSMKLWERVVERRLRSELTFSEQQYGFMPGKSTTDALFASRVLMEKYREGQKELHCVFVDLEKAYDKVPREEAGVLLHEKVWIGREICENSTRYVR